MTPDFLIDFGLSVLFTLLKSNRSKIDKYKKALTKLRDLLNMLYPPDEASQRKAKARKRR
jgi:hypothetical protein